MRAMEYVVMAYLLGVGFIIGCYAEARSSGAQLTGHATPAEVLVVVLCSPIIAIIWGLFLFFKGKED